MSDETTEYVVGCLSFAENCVWNELTKTCGMLEAGRILLDKMKNCDVSEPEILEAMQSITFGGCSAYRTNEGLIFFVDTVG